MKCILLLTFAAIGLSTARPQYYIADTPEVQVAKQQFAAAYNAAVANVAAAGPVTSDVESPAAVPYVHEEIPAEAYVHKEIPAEPYVHIEGPGDAPAAPILPAAQPIQPAYTTLPAAGYAQQLYPAPLNYNLGYYGGLAYAPLPQPLPQQKNVCLNWKGEQVLCKQ